MINESKQWLLLADCKECERYSNCVYHCDEFKLQKHLFVMDLSDRFLESEVYNNEKRMEKIL